MPQSKSKETVVSMPQLKAERQKRKGFDTMNDVADFLGIPEEVLVKAVHQAFIEMANEEIWLTFPLMIQQVETMSRKE